jgi:DNA polymerase-3 subunit delta'
VLIDNIELMNVNSVNALLKFLEEPNANINFILINNNKQILPTLKSRCINFKVFLSFKQSIDIINNIITADVYDMINEELIDNYITPGRLFQILRISNEYNIDLKKTNLKKLLIVLIKDKIYKKDKYLNEIFYYFVESFFRKNLTINNISLHNFYSYFMNKIKDNKIYNLDEESLLMELEEKVLIG